jgi:hypothetical protein
MNHEITAALGPWWTRDHGATQPLRGSSGCCDSSEREREREREREEEVLDLLTNGATWRRSYVDDHTTALNRGSWWCSIGEIISGARRRDWSRTGCGG